MEELIKYVQLQRTERNVLQLPSAARSPWFSCFIHNLPGTYPALSAVPSVGRGASGCGLGSYKLPYMIWYWANDQAFWGGRKGWSWSREAALFIHLEWDACLMTGRAGSWDGFFCTVCLWWGQEHWPGFRLPLWCPFYPSVSSPSLDLGFLTWREFLRPLVNTVTTSCLHRVLLVDKGLACLFSFYTKWWSDHTKSWRGITWAPTPPFPLLLHRCLSEEDSLFQYDRTRCWVDFWLIDTCALVGRGGVVLCENTLGEGLAEGAG